MATAAEIKEVEGLYKGVSYIEVITFFVSGTQYATPVSEVRYIEQDKRKTTRIELDQKLGAEVAIYQGKPVPIYDFANLMGCEAEYKKNLDFLAILTARQRDHEDWTVNLESSLKNNTEFKGALDATQCELGKWLSDYKADGEILAQRDIGELDKALEVLKYQKIRSFAKIIDIFESAKERVINITRPILLYIDTSKKFIAVRLNAISDIVSYKKTAFTSQSDVDDNKKLNNLTFVAGYLENEGNEPPCVLLDWRLFTSPNA
jgi:chemotaxis signal transduction protein